jgi:two-component system sensor histidine kinase TctE
MTLRRRLLLLLLPALVLLLVLGAAVDYEIDLTITRGAHDAALMTAARAAAAYLQTGSSRSSVAALPGLVRILRAGEHDAGQRLYDIADADGRVLTANASLRAALPVLVTQPGAVVLRDARLGDVAVRVASLRADSPAGPVQIDVAEPRAPWEHAQRVMLFGKLLADFAELNLLLLLIWVGVYFGLRPLRRLEQRADRQAGRSLQRFDEATVPAELRSLVVAFNRVVELLQDAAAAQRRFVADAAHQMRTPVAGLLAQIELLAQDPRAQTLTAELTLLQRGTQSLARSANQLLSLARTQTVSALPAGYTHIMLDALVRELVERHLHRADQAGIDLGAETAAVGIDGDPWMMEDLLGNLVDNALKYTARAGRVTVRCGSDAGRPFLEVEDDGPGIPEPERQRVRERFYRRPGAPGIGTGLGLAIVDEIARVHAAAFSIGTGAGGRGARMRVLFQRPGAPAAGESIPGGPASSGPVAPLALHASASASASAGVDAAVNAAPAAGLRPAGA